MNEIEYYQSLMSELRDIELRLESITSKYSEITHLSETVTFEGNEVLFNKLDDLIQTVGHETASTIGFTREQIDSLLKFIAFRIHYSEFSQNDLAIIIDSTHIQPVVMIDMIKSKKMSHENFIKLIDQIKCNWINDFKTGFNAFLKKNTLYSIGK